MDDLARRLVIARHDCPKHQQLLSELPEDDLLIIDDFLAVGIDSDAAPDLFAVLANEAAGNWIEGPVSHEAGARILVDNIGRPVKDARKVWPDGVLNWSETDVEGARAYNVNLTIRHLEKPGDLPALLNLTCA